MTRPHVGGHPFPEPEPQGEDDFWQQEEADQHRVEPCSKGPPVRDEQTGRDVW